MHPDPGHESLLQVKCDVTLKQILVRPKDRIPENEKTGVVYQVPCANCPATYLGQTGRHLDQWLRVEPCDCTNSALADDAQVCHHPVDWHNTKVLNHHQDAHQRLVLESVHISSQPKPLNIDNSPIPQVYNSLFNSTELTIPKLLPFYSSACFSCHFCLSIPLFDILM